MKNKVKIGREAESLVCDYLIEKGFTLRDRNHYLGNLGEIDIVAEKNKRLFIEVRKVNLTQLALGNVITKRKINRLVKLVEIYNSHYYSRLEYRIDLILILENNQETKIDKIFPKEIWGGSVKKFKDRYLIFLEGII